MTLAFTLIELVVVIAVIAILSAVSVAAYMGVISSARKSNDIQELTQIKTEILTELLDGSVTTTFSTSDNNSTTTFIYGSDKLITVSQSVGSTATSFTTGNNVSVAHAITGLIEEWNSKATIAVDISVGNSNNDKTVTISTIYYQRNMTDLTTFACWDLKDDIIETKVETAALVKGTSAYTGEAAKVK